MNNNNSNNNIIRNNDLPDSIGNTSVFNDPTIDLTLKKIKQDYLKSKRNLHNLVSSTNNNGNGSNHFNNNLFIQDNISEEANILRPLHNTNIKNNNDNINHNSSQYDKFLRNQLKDTYLANNNNNNNNNNLFYKSSDGVGSATAYNRNNNINMSSNNNDNRTNSDIQDLLNIIRKQQEQISRLSQEIQQQKIVTHTLNVNFNNLQYKLDQLAIINTTTSSKNVSEVTSTGNSNNNVSYDNTSYLLNKKVNMNNHSNGGNSNRNFSNYNDNTTQLLEISSNYINN
ncbi:uncharacterized protein SCDLUD_002111 [Saccharomycodes ludwigii]|uniref:uncharacterized protein n=1 Tax=Saccharomycodes ludwigii TaxID=36035 RepID=UPI001E855EF4|nr:hypothetical protein SCDLUD_002111 [Saccharomycodes ludwigii]KAH3902293.1 hypothetical protein SCDLUD_002111 [Saccharomycodes ludwigii]